MFRKEGTWKISKENISELRKGKIAHKLGSRKSPRKKWPFSGNIWQKTHKSFHPQKVRNPEMLASLLIERGKWSASRQIRMKQSYVRNEIESEEETNDLGPLIARLHRKCPGRTKWSGLVWPKNSPAQIAWDLEVSHDWGKCSQTPWDLESKQKASGQPFRQFTNASGKAFWWNA